MKLRDYQTDAVDAVFRYWREKEGTAPLVVAPTGSGKSLMIAAAISRSVGVDYFPPTGWGRKSTRVMLATHVKELVEQDVRALKGYDADLRDRIAIWSASLTKKERQKETHFPITAGTIQTIARRLKRITEPIDLLVVDEAHLIPTREQSQYRKLIAHLRSLNPNLRMVGFTATPYRLDQGFLHHGQGATFDGIANVVGMASLIGGGHLVPAKPRWEGAEIAGDKLRIRAGEYTAESQSEAMDLPRMVSDALKAGGGGQQGRWLWFLPSVETAHSAALSLRQAGHRAATVHGAMPAAERDAAIDTFRRGEIEHLTNCALMTTGFDIPEIDRVVLARATKSTALYVQMVGRGLRPSPGKDRCIVLDYGSNVMRHGPVDDPQPQTEKRGKKKAQSSMRKCVACHAFVPRLERVCPECGYVPEPKVRYFSALGKEAVMSLGADDDVPDNVWKVNSVDVRPWNVNVPAKKPTVRVTYRCVPKGKATMEKHFCEWLCPEHGFSSFPFRKYARMWRAHAPGRPPEDVFLAAEGIERHWPVPDYIKAEKRGNFYDITPIYQEREEAA